MREGHIIQIVQRVICKRWLSFEGRAGGQLGKESHRFFYRWMMLAIVLNISTHLHILTNIYIIKQT